MEAEYRKKLIKLLIYIGLAAGVFVAYEPIRHNGFVNYDDNAYITKNPNVSCGLTLKSAIWAFTKSHSGNWHPLTWFSHILDCQLFGLNPPGHHLISLLFHVVNALLLFWILTEMTATTWPSAFVAAVFALHTLQVESVAWAAERKTVLSGLFWLLTMATYISYVKRPGTWRYILLFLVYGLCIMTKPMVVTLPFVLLLLDYWPLERFQWGQSIKTTPKKVQGHKISAGRLIIEKIPLLALSGFLSVMTFVAQQRGGAVVKLESIPFDYRISNAFISYIRYVAKMLWPTHLAVFYPLPETNFLKATGVACAFLFVLTMGLSIYISRRRRYITVGCLWYAGTLVPVLGLVQVGMQSMADRYMYISMLGLLIVAAWSVKDIIANKFYLKIIATALATAVLLTSIVFTRMQVKHWQNSRTLFEHALKVTENNNLAEAGYGDALFEQGLLDEAAEHLNNSLQIQPGYSTARKNLGKVYLKQEKISEAIQCFNEILKTKKNDAEVFYLLAASFSIQKKYDDAIKYFAKALELEPNYADVHNKIGVALMETGKMNEAIPYLNESLRKNPERAEVYVNLGTAYTQLGQYELAIQNWTRAVQIEPNNAYVLNNLAWILAAIGDVSAQDTNRAIEFARRACELTDYKEAEKLDTLAVTYAAAGKFPDAVATAEKALNAAKAAGLEDLAREIQNRLELYQAGRSYRGK